MKKYHFRLGSVMRIRKLEEETARAAVLEAQREVEAATAALDARLATIGAARPMPRRWRAGEFNDDRDQLERYADAVRVARAAEANALSLLRANEAEWTEAARRVRSLERLDERHREAWMLEASRNAQLVTDEIANVHHQQRTQQVAERLAAADGTSNRTGDGPGHDDEGAR